MADIVTQATPDAHYSTISHEETDFNAQIHLDIRGVHFTITRDELMSLPESILLCLFPNGVFVDIDGNVITNLTENDVVYVNYDPQCFQYILGSFSEAAKELPPNHQHDSYDNYTTDAHVLEHKPAIIVLREDLDYYCIPPIKGLTKQQMKSIKLAAGSVLVESNEIFRGLGYAPGTNLGPAEQHLLDMLCSSGFDITGLWGHRSMEPGKTVVNSLSLVRLHHAEPTPIPTSPSSPSLKPITSNGSISNSRKSRFASLANSARSASRSLSRNRSPSKSENSTSTKLLLFWRKPARKCWWSHQIVDIEIPNVLANGNHDQTTSDKVTIRVHIRRVWTLELSVIGVH